MYAAGILMNAFDEEFVMQVGACCSSGGADGANNLTLSDALALFYLALVQVQVMGFVVFAVLNEYIVAVGTGVTGFQNTAIPRGIDRRSTWRGIIGAPMGPLGFVNRMKSVGIKVGADPGKV